MAKNKTINIFNVEVGASDDIKTEEMLLKIKQKLVHSGLANVILIPTRNGLASVTHVAEIQGDK